MNYPCKGMCDQDKGSSRQGVEGRTMYRKSRQEWYTVGVNVDKYPKETATLYLTVRLSTQETLLSSGGSFFGGKRSAAFNSPLLIL